MEHTTTETLLIIWMAISFVAGMLTTIVITLLADYMSKNKQEKKFLISKKQYEKTVKKIFS
ncbi:hypothetical protein EZY14_002670 [Kordia sp. TARA_039_SRF]|nr:hypothetical protein EZY14_002670 [Kordia sp. TARA_039_SRF]